MKIYLVGGAVRDKLLNYPSDENDWVVVGSSPEQMVELGYQPVGQDFPVFIKPQTGEEYALARTERKSGHGYQGFTFHTAVDISLEDDLIRRDLTINAMAEDDSGQIIDPYGGQVWGYFGVIEQINKHETRLELMGSDLEKNTEFRIKWPRGEMGSLPADSEQFMMIEDLYKTTEKLNRHIENMALNKVNIQFLRKQMDKVLEDIEELKDKNRDMYYNGNGAKQ